MAQTYTLFKVKKFLHRIREEQERAEVLLAKVKASPEEYKPDTIEHCRARIDLCEDLLRIGEGIFGSDAKEES